MNIEIIAVGTELTTGQICNTNAQYISRRLNEMGMKVKCHTTVPDEPSLLSHCINKSLDRANILITTGGLGPTKDDLTKETISLVLGKELILDQNSLNIIENFFKSTGRPMTSNNTKQAYFPDGSIIIPNHKGTAPGCIINTDNNIIIMLPGPPYELIPMFEDSVIPYLSKKSQKVFLTQSIRVFGLGESALENQIEEFMGLSSNVKMATYVKNGDIEIRVWEECEKEADHDDNIRIVVNKIHEKLNDYVYSIEGLEFAEVVAKLLMAKSLTLSIAESCTGGMVSGKLTDIPGISCVLDRTIVSYSNQSKIDNLNVNPNTILKYGAVSKQTALEMAEGIRQLSGTNLGIAVTGIAGPDGGTPDKPVGLVYIALSDCVTTKYQRLNLKGDRNSIRNQAVLYTFNLLYRHIL